MAQTQAKTALITGASAGIGEATAFVLAERGYNLILVARREDRLKNISDEIQKLFQVRVDTLVCDVKNREQINSLVKENKKLFSEITVLINSAGLASGVDAMPEAKLEDWDEMIDTNVKGLLYWTRMILPFMLEKNSGHIVNLGSVAGHWVYPGGGVYCATKFAVRAISEGLRMDLKGSPVRVTNIEPGMVETEFSLVRLKDSEKAKAVYQGMQALKAKDIAECILWSIERPPHVNIQELVVFPTDQAAVGQVARK